MRMDRTESFWDKVHLDPLLLAGTLALLVAGLGILHSASGSNDALVLRQGVHMLIGLAVMVTIAQVPPEALSRVAPALYVAGLLLLLLLFVLGTGRGTRRWFDLGIIRFQPSELMKLAVPLICARLFAAGNLPPTLARIGIACMFIALPALLIAKQPDLGTATLIAAAGAISIFLAGLQVRYIFWSVIGGLLSLVPLWGLLHDYQRQRVLTLLDPEKDPLGAGYHIIQSVIAVGSGGLFGKGWLNGTQSRLEFLPERHTDFIFAVICEEFGFVGAMALIAAYLLVVVRGLQIAAGAQDTFGRLLAATLSLTLFVYVFVNTGMMIGQLPVVGVPLPLVSYGGTSLVTLLAAFGILMSVHTHRKRLSF